MWFRNNSQNAPANPVDNKSKMKRKKVLVVKSSRSKEEMLKGKKQEEDKQDIVKQESIEPENLKQEQEAKEEETSVDVTDNTNGSMPLIPDNESGQTPDKEADPPEDTVVNIPEVLEEIAQEEHVEEKAALNESEEEKKDVFVEKVSDVLSDSECEQDRKKPKTKHRKTMSMSNTIELVKNMGDEWIEAAKREFEEHSKKKENKKESKDHGSHQSLDKKKDYSDKGSDCSKSLCDFRDSGGVVILLSDATVGETDDFETVEESDFSSKKHQKKKESKSLKEPKGSSKTSQIMSAQKMNVKKIAKASSAGALSFIRKRKSHGNSNAAPGSINQRDSVDYATLSTALFIDSERTHTEMVEDVKVLLKNRLKNVVNTVEDEKVVKPAVESPDVSDEDAEEIFYDAKNDLESSEETRGVMLPPKNLLPKLAEAQRSGKMSSQRSRKTLGGSLKRTGGKRKVRRRSTADEAIPPPLPPRVILAHPPPKHGSHWLFGNSFKGDGRRDDDSGADGVSHLTDSSHFNSDHASDRTDTSWRGGSNLTSKPVTRAESYRDRADRVKRTKRKTSDPNQLTSAKDYHDAEAVGGGPALPGGPSGGSSNSSLSSKSNDSSHIENHGSQSEWSDEEEDSSMPWSALAPPELVATMSALARKRQDLIHELISSEASHVRWLRVLRRVFLTPLQRSGGSLLPSNELKNLFPNLPDVLQRHKRLALDLRNLKANAATVKTKPLAEALVNTLGEARYAGALAKFCGGQGLALETLRERRRRNKELNAFLARSEQDPLCARLRLQDLLACVWQRLTKYQLLLEGIVKTAGAEEDLDSQALEDEDFARVAHALHLAKDVLHTVNTAIKTTENDHRLKSIQSKLEVRGGGDVEIYEEIRKIDLTKHSLIMEGTLNIRQEYNKRVNVLALLLRECLVLLHTDGEKYVLRPVPQTNTPFSPVVKWNTALFRPNAAVKNSFFLVNLENMHMYELCATTPSEYNTWVKHLREAAKALEGKGGTTDEGPPPPLPSAPPPVSVTTTVESASNGNNTPEASSAPTDEGNPKPKPCSNEDDGNQVSGALQSVVGEEEAGLANNEGKRCSKLLAPEEISVAVPPTTMTAHIQLTPEERLRRAEEKVTMALSEAAEAVKLVTGSQRIHLKASTEQLVGKEFNQQEDLDQEEASMSTEQLVMIAQSHVNSLTEVLLRALRVSSSDCSMTKCEIRPDFGLCDSCSYHLSKYSTLRSMKQTNGNNKSFDSGDVDQKQDGDLELRWRDSRTIDDAEQRVDSIIVENIGESSTDPVNDMESTKVSASGLGLRRTLSILERRLVSSEREREVLRARLQQADNRIHRMHQLHKDCLHNEQPVKQEVCQQAITANSTDQSGGEG